MIEIKPYQKEYVDDQVQWEIKNPGVAVMNHILFGEGVDPKIRDKLLFYYIGICQKKISLNCYYTSPRVYKIPKNYMRILI